MRVPLPLFVGSSFFWLLTGCGSDAAPVDHAALAQEWVDQEFQPSTLTREEQKTRIPEAMERYELGRLTRQRAGTLSGGQKQRLALAAATLHEPELLFLDEPTSAVDPENRRAFWESLFDLVDEGTTILVSTHYMDEAERCHALAILDLGVLVAAGSPEQSAQPGDHGVGGQTLELIALPCSRHTFHSQPGQALALNL